MAVHEPGIPRAGWVLYTIRCKCGWRARSWTWERVQEEMNIHMRHAARELRAPAMRRLFHSGRRPAPASRPPLPARPGSLGLPSTAPPVCGPAPRPADPFPVMCPRCFADLEISQIGMQRGTVYPPHDALPPGGRHLGAKPVRCPQSGKPVVIRE